MRQNLVCKTVKMPPEKLKTLKKIAHMQQRTLINVINEKLDELIEENQDLVKQYDEIFGNS